MVGGWLVKVIVGIALLGFAVVELGSPFVARAQADDAAHEVANEASFRLRDNFTQQALDDACKSEADKQQVTLVACDYAAATDEVRVTVTKHARSFVLDKFGATKEWYDVDASAQAKRK
ncbi:MAG TPA: hypothetical protein VM143_09580 [Acidimicrobiales bacterium]|nr:hypothetical protein [Acidimicrobiales bacterium]